jgi:SAM-dependent methyltransferase
MKGNSAYWNERYKSGDTGWDIGSPSGPLAGFLDKLADKSLKILIPGCGNAYEAELLHHKGFKNVYVLDISHLPLQKFRERNPDFSDDHLLCEDFFSHTGSYDLILEQTFFCAIDRHLRDAYVRHMNSLLHNNGILAGVLFNKEFTDPGPPHGGTKEEYLQLFSPWFIIEKMEDCRNSIPKRAGNELFMLLRKKP